jgi:GDP-4-dehydro-6-deoxy-D-mannose reductase
MKVLVTGADGFVGRHLINELLASGHQVVAGIQKGFHNSQLPVPILYFDLLDTVSIQELLEEACPDGIIHLAAQSMVKTAWEDPGSTLMVNTVGTVNLIQTLKVVCPKTLMITIGSSEEYGLTGKIGEPLTEEHPCLPQNPYAISKMAVGQLALQIAKRDNLNIIHVRPFNHFGPGQREGFVVSDFSAQIARIEKGVSIPVIKVGDLTAQRDFTDVRDVVTAYTSLLEAKPPTGIYNVCSGTPHTAKEILDCLLQNSSVPIKVQVDSERIRTSDVPLFIGSFDKIKRYTGWEPKRNFNYSLMDTLQWWRLSVIPESS